MWVIACDSVAKFHVVEHEVLEHHRQIGCELIGLVAGTECKGLLKMRRRESMLFIVSNSLSADSPPDSLSTLISSESNPSATSSFMVTELGFVGSGLAENISIETK